MSSILDALRKIEQEKAESTQAIEANLDDDGAARDLIGGPLRQRGQSAPVTWLLLGGVLVLLLVVVVGLVVVAMRPTAVAPPPLASAAPPQAPPSNATVPPPAPASQPTAPPPTSLASTPAAPTPPEPAPPVTMASVVPVTIPQNTVTPAPTPDAPVKFVDQPRADEPKKEPVREASAVADDRPKPAPAPKPIRPKKVREVKPEPEVVEPVEEDLSEEPVAEEEAPKPAPIEFVKSEPVEPAAPRAVPGPSTAAPASPQDRQMIKVNMPRPANKQRPYDSAVINLQPVFLNETIPGTNAKLVKVREDGVEVVKEDTGERVFVPF